MRARFFYWLKIYLGFSRQESKGFVLLIPFLLLLVGAKVVVKEVRKSKAENFHVQYLATIDSLESAGVFLVSSHFAVFNPQDTIIKRSNEKQLENLNRIPFAEADSVLLQIVPGIGQSTASRIVKFRENLGGLHSKNQLIAYKKQHGSYQSSDDFLKIRIFKQEWIDKFSPYLDFE